MAEKKKKQLQFLNSYYTRQQWGKNDKGKSVVVQNDCLILVYKDEETGLKHVKTIEEPDFEFYVAKEDVEIKHPLSFIPIEQTDIIKCKYNDHLLTMAELAGQEDVYWDHIRDRKMSRLKEFHFLPFVFSSDMDIEDYYKMKFLQKYENSGKLNKSFFDIEVDGIEIDGFPDEKDALAPVNAISFVNEETKEFYMLLLRNKENKKIAKYEANLEKHKKKLIKKYFNNKEDYPALMDYELKFKFFDKELKLIKYFFNLINELQPDFCMA